MESSKKRLAVGLGVAAACVVPAVVISFLQGSSAIGETARVETRPDAKSGVASTQSTQVALAAKKTYQPGDVHVGDSRVYVFVGKTGFGHEHGVEGKLASGRLVLDGPNAGGKLVFDMTSFRADTPAARRYVGLEGTTDAATRRKVDANMLGPDVLNVRAYPRATFTTTSVTPWGKLNGRPRYQIKGRFTLHGKTRPITVFATAVRKGDWIHVQGKFSIRQTDFGIEPFSKAFGAIGVADKLTIWGDLWLAAEGKAAG